MGVGEKGKNNGVMILVAIEDRRVRIEVGKGLESIIPDALASQIIKEQLVPSFKKQQYAQGVSKAVERIAGIVEQHKPAASSANLPFGQSSGRSSPSSFSDGAGFEV